MPNLHTYVVSTEEEMLELGKQLAGCLTEGMTILLDGELGAGKTTLTKGIAAGLGIQQVIKSPTYTLIREYTTGRMPLYHMDVYRLEESGGYDLGFEEYFYGEGLCVVEWSVYIAEDLPDFYLRIRIDRINDSSNGRQLTFLPKGEMYEKVVNTLCQVLN